MSVLKQIEIYQEEYQPGKWRLRFRVIRTLERSDIKWEGNGPSFDHFLFDLSERGTKFPGWANSIFQPSSYDVAQGTIPDGTYMLTT